MLNGKQKDKVTAIAHEVYSALWQALDSDEEYTTDEAALIASDCEKLARNLLWRVLDGTLSTDQTVRKSGPRTFALLTDEELREMRDCEAEHQLAALEAEQE